MDKKEYGHQIVEQEKTGFEQKIVQAFATADIENIISVLKDIDILLTGKAECEFANKGNLEQLKAGLADLLRRNKPYVFYLSDGGASRLVLDKISISPSPNCSKEVREKWEKIK